MQGSCIERVGAIRWTLWLHNKLGCPCEFVGFLTCVAFVVAIAAFYLSFVFFRLLGNFSYVLGLRFGVEGWTQGLLGYMILVVFCGWPAACHLLRIVFSMSNYDSFFACQKGARLLNRRVAVYPVLCC